MPRMLGYAFNPVSFYFCYDCSEALSVIVLEVNNTFGEKHLYVLGRDFEDNKRIRKGYDMSFTVRRAFHVSPFNDRKGFYQALCKDPSLGKLDMRIVMYVEAPPFQTKLNLSGGSSSGRKKMVAAVAGPSYPLSLLTLHYALITFPLDVFMTMPRIMKEAFKLHYRKGLGIFHRPNPIEGTVVKLEPNFIDLYAQKVVVDYLTHLVFNFPEPISLVINLPSPNKPPIHILPIKNDTLETTSMDFSSTNKQIIITLANYKFFTNILFNQTIHRALIVGYFEKAWDCNDLSLFLRFFFNSALDKNTETIFRGHKRTLSVFERRASVVRRWYIRSVVEGKMSGGEAKKELDMMLHKLWPRNGEENRWKAAIAQNDVTYDVRLSGSIHRHKDMATALRDLVVEKEDGRIDSLFEFQHMYLLTVPSSGSLTHLAPIVTSQLHLLPFPPRYLPYESKEPIVHPIDHFLSSSAKDGERRRHLQILIVGAIVYRLDSWFSQKTTGFVEGPSGNPFITEKNMWEGIVEMLKQSDGTWINQGKNVFEQWEVVYEKQADDEKLHLVAPTPTTDAPLMRSLAQAGNHIQEDTQHRLWLYMKTYREVVLMNKDLLE